MTVGIGLIFRWHYGSDDSGWAMLGASDRMLTDNDAAYEPPQMKVGGLGRRVSLLTAGSMHIHSEALRASQRELHSNPTESVHAIAEVYAAQIRAVRIRLASQRYLAPHALDEVSFLMRQRDMSPDLVSELAHKIERFSLDVEAIILGIDSDGSPNVYHVDGDGIGTCHSDVGFITIGNGGPHAKLQIMAARYSQHALTYWPALGLIYSAKKRSEAAPGVGASTDVVLITRNGSELLYERTIKQLDLIHRNVMDECAKANVNGIAQIGEYFKTLETGSAAHKSQTEDQQKGAPNTSDLPD